MQRRYIIKRLFLYAGLISGILFLSGCGSRSGKPKDSIGIYEKAAGVSRAEKTADPGSPSYFSAGEGKGEEAANAPTPVPAAANALTPEAASSKGLTPTNGAANASAPTPVGSAKVKTPSPTPMAAVKVPSPTPTTAVKVSSPTPVAAVKVSSPTPSSAADAEPPLSSSAFAEAVRQEMFAAIGSARGGELLELEEGNAFAAIRAAQLPTGFDHSSANIYAAAVSSGIDIYISEYFGWPMGVNDVPMVGHDGVYYSMCEAIVKAGTGSVLTAPAASSSAAALTEVLKSSAGHWSYVGNASVYPYASIGVFEENGMTYASVVMWSEF